jgi:hypothetical protein
MAKPKDTDRYTLDLDSAMNQEFTEFARRCGKPKAKLARLALVLLMQYKPEVVKRMMVALVEQPTAADKEPVSEIYISNQCQTKSSDAEHS